MWGAWKWDDELLANGFLDQGLMEKLGLSGGSVSVPPLLTMSRCLPQILALQ